MGLCDEQWLSPDGAIAGLLHVYWFNRPYGTLGSIAFSHGLAPEANCKRPYGTKMGRGKDS